MSEPKSVVHWNLSLGGVALAVAVAIGVAVYFLTREGELERPRPVFNAFEEILVGEASLDLAKNLPAIPGIETVVLIPIRDPENKGALAVEAFHQALRETGRYQSIDEASVLQAIAKLMPEGGEVADGPQAVKLLREYLVDKDKKPIADAVVLTRAEIEGRDGDQARVWLEAEMYSAQTGMPVVEKGFPKSSTAKIEGKWNLRWLAGAMHDSSALGRIFAWVLVTGLLPFAASSLVRKITKRERNRDNALMVLCFAAVSSLFAYFLMGFWLRGAGSSLLLISAIVLGAFYNLWACTLIYEKGRG